MEVTRERAWETLTRYTKGESLLRHALAVEASTRSYARRFGEDEEAWGATALLHDFDYEIHPTLDKHPQDGAPILREEGYPEWLIEAVLSHAEHLAMERDTPLKKTLFACDEISGFVHACGLVRPLGLEGLEPKSVKKKLKQPSFAAGIHRDEVYVGAELLGVTLDEHIVNVVAALQPISEELGLRTASSISLAAVLFGCRNQAEDPISRDPAEVASARYLAALHIFQEETKHYADEVHPYVDETLAKCAGRRYDLRNTRDSFVSGFVADYLLIQLLYEPYSRFVDAVNDGIAPPGPAGRIQGATLRIRSHYRRLLSAPLSPCHILRAARRGTLEDSKRFLRAADLKLTRRGTLSTGELERVRSVVYRATDALHFSGEKTALSSTANAYWLPGDGP